MQRILFATDFGENAPAIFQYTLLLADKLKASIVVCHAFGSGELFTEKDIRSREAASLKRMQSFIGEHLPDKYEHIEIEYVADKRFANEALPEVVKQQSIDMAVMGMKKGSRLLDMYLGNTTLEVSLMLPCAVLIVPEGFFTDQISEIACTTNFRFRDIALIHWLRSLAKKFGRGASIHCLHVVQPKADRSRADKDMKVLQDIFDRQSGISVEFRMEEGELIDTLEYFTVSRTIDLLVMNSHQRRILNNVLPVSTSRKVSIHTKVPLLILKDL